MRRGVNEAGPPDGVSLASHHAPFSRHRGGYRPCQSLLRSDKRYPRSSIARRPAGTWRASEGKAPKIALLKTDARSRQRTVQPDPIRYGPRRQTAGYPKSNPHVGPRPGATRTMKVSISYSRRVADGGMSLCDGVKTAGVSIRLDDRTIAAASLRRRGESMDEG